MHEKRFVNLRPLKTNEVFKHANERNNNTITMKKQNYTAPSMEQMTVSVEMNFVATGEKLTSIGGSWDSEE